MSIGFTKWDTLVKNREGATILHSLVMQVTSYRYWYYGDNLMVANREKQPKPEPT